MILIEGNDWKDHYRAIGNLLKSRSVETVIVMSPHFVSWKDRILVQTTEKLECIQDYYGFPDELYKYCYSARNDVELALALLEQGGNIFRETSSWGLDHGAWIPLMYMFPDGVRSVAVSISMEDPSYHSSVGREIRRIAEKVGRKRVAFIGTGSPTHRLDALYMTEGKWDRPTPFDRLLMDAVEKGDCSEILSLHMKREWSVAQPEGNLAPLYSAMGFADTCRGKVMKYAIPWPGVSMIHIDFDTGL